MNITIDTENVPSIAIIGTELAEAGVTKNELAYIMDWSGMTADKVLGGGGSNKMPFESAVKLIKLHRERCSD